MKKIPTILFILFAYTSQAQVLQEPQLFGTLFRNLGAKEGLLIPTFCGTPTLPPKMRNYGQSAIAYDSCGHTFYVYDPSTDTWNNAGVSEHFIDSLIAVKTTVRGTAITSLPQVGFSPNATNLSDWIDSVFYASQPPTATLTGGQTLEYQSAGTINKTLNWTAGRQSATNPISSIVVAGTNESFSQPAQGAAASGTQSVSFPANTNITYTNTVTTTDNKTASATTTFSFAPKRYFGFITDTTGIGTSGFDDSKIYNLSSELSASKSKSFSTGNPAGTQFFVYAYYATAGALTQWDMNGFPSLLAMNSVTRNFTNALGYTGQWIIYWSKNGQTLSSTIVAN